MPKEDTPFFVDAAEHASLSDEEKKRYRETREFLLTRGWYDVDRIAKSPPESSATHRFVRTPGGHATLLYGADGGRQGVLHHVESPDEKAREWWRPRMPEDPDLLVFHGLGLGYSIPDLLARADRGVRILIAEADAVTFRFLLALRDCRRLLAHPNIEVILPRTPEEAAAKTHDWLIQTPGAGRVRMLVDPPAMVPQPTFVRDWYDALAKGFPRMATTLAKSLRDDYPHPTNLAHNWPLLQNRPGIGRLFGKMEGRPAVVIGAGPGLDADLPLIKEIQDRLLIVACDTSIRLLLESGVRVDLALAIDSSPRNHDHFKNLHEGAFLPVLFGGVHPPLLEQYRNQAWIAATAPFPTVDLLEALPGPSTYLRQKGTLVMNGSVGSGALDLALKLGCSPVFLAGIDLAYADGKDHARGTIYDEDTAFQDRQPGLFDLPCLDGGRVPTCSPFLISLFGIAHQIAQVEVPVYNLSQSGGAIPGAGGREEGLQTLRSLEGSGNESPRARLEVEADMALRSGGHRRRERGRRRTGSHFPIDDRGRLSANPDGSLRLEIARENLERLARQDASTANVLEASLTVLESGRLTRGETCGWLPGPEGYPQVVIRSPDGRTTWRSPATDSPWEEVREWRVKDSLDRDTGPVILGAGLGFHLRELLEGLSQDGSIWVWEPYADRLAACLGVADFRLLFAESRINWAVGMNAETLFQTIERRTPEFLEDRPLTWRPWIDPSFRGWVVDSEREFLDTWFGLFGRIYPVIRRVSVIKASA